MSAEADRLVSQAWAPYAGDRHQEAAAAAAQAANAASQLGDPVLLVRALRIGATAQSLLGDDAAALACYTQILGLAEDPATRDRLGGPSAAEAVAVAYWSWVRCARSLPGISVLELHQVLDAAAASGWDRSAAHEGLARCALAAGDLATALREARAVAGGSLAGTSTTRWTAETVLRHQRLAQAGAAGEAEGGPPGGDPG